MANPMDPECQCKPAEGHSLGDVAPLHGVERRNFTVMSLSEGNSKAKNVAPEHWSYTCGV